jgi:4-hydroxy-2-oxoglutarate aldolase
MPLNLSGILPPICTPFGPDGDLALDHLRSNIEKYNRIPLRGYVAAGSTGESAFLTTDEKLRIWDTVRDTAAPGRLVIAGAGAESVRATIALSNAAAARGCDAVLILTPHYYKGQMARRESQLGYFRAVADAVRLPVLIYNFPQMTGIDLAADIVQELAQHPNIAGIKESSPDLGKIGSVLDAVPKGFPVLIGASGKYAASLAMGATGGVLAVANALPGAAAEIHERHTAGDIDGARQVQERIIEAAAVAPKFGIQGLKYAMDLMGIYGGPPRPPLLPVSAQEKCEIEAVFRAFGCCRMEDAATI